MPETSADVWEERYGSARVWSGQANPALVHHVSDLEPGTALDLGSGEGADALWLAERGWRVTGVDVSATALARAAAHAEERGARVAWVEADLAEWEPEATYDLVTSFFLHSPVNFPRAQILRNAAAAVAPGGVLLTVGHASFPPWSRHHHESHHPDPTEPPSEAAGGEAGPRFPTIAQTISEAGLGRGWDLLVADNLPREVTGPEGQRATILDSVVKARRREQPRSE